MVLMLICCQLTGLSDLRLGHALAVNHTRTAMAVAAPHQGLMAWLHVAPRGEHGFVWPMMELYECIKGPGVFLDMSFVGGASAACVCANAPAVLHQPWTPY